MNATSSPAGASQRTTSRRRVQRQHGSGAELAAAGGAVTAVATGRDAGGVAAGAALTTADPTGAGVVVGAGLAAGFGAGGRSSAAPARAGGVKMLPHSGHGVGWPAA